MKMTHSDNRETNGFCSEDRFQRRVEGCVLSTSTAAAEHVQLPPGQGVVHRGAGTMASHEQSGHFMRCLKDSMCGFPRTRVFVGFAGKAPVKELSSVVVEAKPF